MALFQWIPAIKYGYKLGFDEFETTGATNGQVLKYNATSGAWEPGNETVSPGEIALTNGNILVGNGSNVAAGVAMSGDASVVAAGTVTVTGTTAERVAFIPATAPQALTGAGAVNITAYQTRFTSNGTGNALTLANATRTGLLKKVSYVAEGGGADTGVITPATPSGFATVTLNAIGDYVQFLWTGAAWIVVEYVGATVA